MARRARSRRERLEKPSISLTPLIDTALTLLIIFMITTPMMMRNAIKVSLPEGNAKEAGKNKPELVVYMDAKEHIFFNDQQLSLDKLISMLKEHVGVNKEQTVFVRADKSVQYGMVIKVVDQIKVVGGVSYVALATQGSQQA